MVYIINILTRNCKTLQVWAFSAGYKNQWKIDQKIFHTETKLQSVLL